jgi:hypothetical protein
MELEKNQKPQQMKKFAIRDVETVKTTAILLYPIFACIGRFLPF